MMAVVVVVFSGSAFADVTQSLHGTQNQNVGITFNPNIGVNSQNTNNNYNNSQSRSDAYSNSTGGSSILNFDYTNQREFLNGIGGYQVGLTGGPNTNGHHRTAQTRINMRMRINQVSFNNMVKFLERSNDMDSSTRTWEDMRDDLVVQPRFDYPKAALSDSDYVVIVDAASINLANIGDDDVVGFVTVRDRKPRENSVDKMYMVEAIYPYAKIGGVNLLVKVDDFFWAKVKSGSWGAGIGGVLSTIISCFTGGAGSINGGYTSGSSMEHVAGGEMYLALRISEKPAPPIPTPTPKYESQKPTCDRVSIQIRIDNADRRIVRCTTWCLENMVNRRDAAEANIDMFVCTGELRYLRAAKFHFLKLRDNYLKKGGSSIRANQRSANAMMSKAFLDWAICIKTLEGKKATYKFVAKYNLDMNVEALPTFTK
jgi:hypothetical protein